MKINHTITGKPVMQDTFLEMRGRAFKCVAHVKGEITSQALDTRLDELALVYWPCTPHLTASGEGVYVWFKHDELLKQGGDAPTIAGAVITTAPALAYGIPGETIRIAGVIADPSVFPMVTRASHVEHVRERLRRCFEEILGEPVGVHLVGWDKQASAAPHEPAIASA